MPVSDQTIGQIESHLRSFETACAEHDMPRLAALLHRDVHGFLPHPGGAFSSREDLLKLFGSYFLKLFNPSFCIYDERIDADGVVAWVSAPCRFTHPISDRDPGKDSKGDPGIPRYRPCLDHHPAAYSISGAYADNRCRRGTPDSVNRVQPGHFA